MASLGELFVELGVFGDVEDLKKAEKKIQDFIKTNDKAKKGQDDFSKSIKEGMKSFAVIVTAITGAVYALDRLTASLMNSNNAMLDLTRQSDISLSTFQKWDSVGKMFGINNAAQQIENLNQKLFQLKLTGEGARGFQLAGIMPTNAEDVMEQLRNRIKGLDNTSASYLLQQMGLDPKMITLLRLTRTEYEELTKEMSKYQLTEEQRQSLAKMNVQLQIANQKLQYLKDRILLKIIPIFIDLKTSFARVTIMLAKFVNWLGKAKSGFALFTRSILTFGLIKSLPKVITMFKECSNIFSQIMSKIPVLGSMFKGLGAIFSRVLLPLTMLYLLLDDIAVFLSGGESVIGDIVNWGSKIGEQFTEALGKMFGGDFFAGLGDLFATLIKVLEDVLQSLTNLLERILNFFTFGLWDKFRDWQGKDGFLNGASRFLIPTNPQQRLNNISNNKNTNITQTNYIQTEQAADSIYNELTLANAIFGR